MKRLQVTLDDKAEERLESIKSMMEGKKSDVAVVRNGLQLLEWYHLMLKDGCTLAIVKDDNIKEVQLFF